jgi:uncharacterized protein (DUF1810 family)
MSKNKDYDVHRLVRNATEVSKSVKHLNDMYSVEGDYARVFLARLHRLNDAVKLLDYAVEQLDETERY